VLSYSTTIGNSPTRTWNNSWDNSV